MRNIFRVVLWKLPLSFCALAQRSGRTVRDFEQLGEAILFVPAKVLKDGLAEEEARVSREEAAEPGNQEGDIFVPEPEEGVDIIAGQAVVVGEGGARVEQNAEPEDVDSEAVTAAEKKKKRKATRQSAADALEASFLSRFACTTVAIQNNRRIPMARRKPTIPSTHGFFLSSLRADVRRSNQRSLSTLHKAYRVGIVVDVQVDSPPPRIDYKCLFYFY
ncbi:hypothetical protein B0H13DRAFT_1859033 [Mycena leptocephala]|nr:hypothetical protein B0H13DRAFT_1859033 [Mycena leptocephala]